MDSTSRAISNQWCTYGLNSPNAEKSFGGQLFNCEHVDFLVVYVGNIGVQHCSREEKVTWGRKGGVTVRRA